MAIVQSQWIKGQQTTIRPQTAGDSSVTEFIYDFGKETPLAAGDILELGILPAYAIVHAATIFTEGTFTALTADVGLMSGEVGAATNPDGTARTSGNEAFAAVDLTTFASLSKKDMLLVAPSEKERSIGVKVSDAVAAAAGKKLHLLLFYRQ